MRTSPDRAWATIRVLNWLRELGEVCRGRVWQPDRQRLRRWLTHHVAPRAHGLAVADLDEAAAEAERLGARPAPNQPDPRRWRVLLDPAGHPFCLTNQIPARMITRAARQAKGCPRDAPPSYRRAT